MKRTSSKKFAGAMFIPALLSLAMIFLFSNCNRFDARNEEFLSSESPDRPPEKDDQELQQALTAIAQAAASDQKSEIVINTSNIKFTLNAAMDEIGVIRLVINTQRPDGSRVENFVARFGRDGRTEKVNRKDWRTDGIRASENDFAFKNGVLTHSDSVLYHDNGNLKQWAYQSYDDNGIRKHWHYGRHARQRTALILREGEYYDKDGWTDNKYIRTYYKNPFIDQILGSFGLELKREMNIYYFSHGGRLTSHLRRGYDGNNTKRDLQPNSEAQNDFYERVVNFDWHGRCERYEDRIEEEGRDINRDGKREEVSIGTVQFKFDKNVSKIQDGLPWTCDGECPNRSLPTLLPIQCRESNPPPECSNPTL